MARISPVAEAIKADVVALHSAGQWKGRESAVMLGKKHSVPSTHEVLRIADLAIKAGQEIND